jgi:hypothetical protein
LLLPSAGKGAWLSVLAAVPLVLAVGWILDKLAAEKGFAIAVRERLGQFWGRLLLIIYSIWGILLLSLRLRLCALRLAAGGTRDGSLWFFLLGLAALTLWMGRGKLSAFARAGQLFLAALLVTAAVVLGLSLSQIRPERLLPLTAEEVPGILFGTIQAVGVLGWGMFTAFLLGDTAEQGERKGWHWTFWGLGGCALLSLAQAVIIGNLGTVLAGRLDSPFFALAKSVGIEGAFQRVESVVVAIWLFSDLAMATLLVFGVRRGIETIWKECSGTGIVLVSLALNLFPLWNQEVLEQWSRQIVPMGNLILGVGIPIILLFMRKPEGKTE